MLEASDCVQWFTELRREEAARAPSFQATLSTARDRRRRAPLGWRLKLLTAGAIAVIVSLAGINSLERVLARRAFVTSLLTNEQWIGPTDFLLDAPGSALLRTIPPLGSVEALIPINTLNQGRTP